MKSFFFKHNLLYIIPILLFTCNLQAQKVKLSEVGFNSSYNATTFGAIIEVQNYGDTPIDLAGYSIEDPSTGYSNADQRTYLNFETVGCGDDMTLEPNEVVSVFRFLNKDSQTINLYAPNDKLLSSVTWGDSPYFVTASELGVWSNGPTPVIPEGGAIVNIGDGTSWLDWIAVSERTPCVANNNSGHTARKNILIFEAENATKAKSKIITISGDSDNEAVQPNRKGAYLEWDVTVNRSGIYDVFLSYSNIGDNFNTLKGVLTVNDNKSNSLVQFAHTTATVANSEKLTWLNEFTKIHLKKGTNVVRFKTTDNLKGSEVLIDYLGLVIDDYETVVEATSDISNNLPSGYCRVQSNSAKDEWISNFALGTIDNNSGSTVFTDFSALTTVLTPGAIYNYKIVPAWSGTIYNEGYAIWIDYNGNGSFDEEGEKVVSVLPSRISVTKGSFTIPEDAVTGVTKIRVAMKYNAEPTLACSAIENGEIEEYTAVIQTEKKLVRDIAVAKIRPAIALFPLPVVNQLNIDITETIEAVEVLDMRGQKVLEAGSVKQIDMGSLSAGMYIIVIKTASQTHTKQISKIAH